MASTRGWPTWVRSRAAARSFAKPASTSRPGSRTCTIKSEIVEALRDLRAKRPGIRTAVMKLNDSFSGEGNALLRYPESSRRPRWRAPCSRWSSRWDPRPRKPTSRSSRAWAGSSRSSSTRPRRLRPAPASAQPHEEVVAISTHDQILGGPSGQVFLGCRFPADDGYRLRIQEAGLRIGEVLAATAR